MKLMIVIDIDTKESGLDEELIKNDIVNFTRDLLVNGAIDQEVSFALKEVDYDI